MTSARWWLACLVPLTLIGCGRGADRDDLQPQFVFSVGDWHNNFDPQRISWVSDNRLASSLYEPLVRMNAQTMTIEPGAAESWTLSDDQLTYTFRLRPAGRWSNGDPVVAGDFIHAWRRALLPDQAADYTMLLYCIRGAEEFFHWRLAQLEEYVRAGGGDPRELWRQAVERFDQTVAVHAVDDHTLVVELARPTSYFLELAAFVTFFPNHVKSVEAATSFKRETGHIDVDAAYWSDPKRLVSNGAYALRRSRFQRDVLLVANEHYWNRANVHCRSILERVITEPQAAMMAYGNGEIHWLPDVPTASALAAQLVRQNRPDVRLVPMAGVYFYNFNCAPTLSDGRKNPLADQRVRQALAMGFDRQVIVSQVTQLNQPLTRTFVPAGAMPGYDPPADAGLTYDVDKARALLADAGFPGGAGLTGLSILYNSGMGHESIAQAIKRMWETNLGVIVSLEGVEGKSFSERLKKHDYSICRASWFGDYRDPTTFLDKMITGNGNNDCVYSNPEYDALLRLAAEQSDPAQRMATLREAESLMLQDSPMAMIFQYLNLYVFDAAKVKDLHLNPWAIYRLDQVKLVEQEGARGATQ